ncbi:uncharacterized protein LOC105437484 [Strongylocentrotus purpuratus]|uniref:Death domain-containing protein n=1 Tax=Strongylocentrotus purpuratus TaxID=7668 RepID=A0A7M7SVS0_STRPU|nr:uncharacterized protein LOC105437484 [Strongylocentrotus purpuratus]
MEKGLTEMMLLDMTNEIGNHVGLKKFGVKLGFTLMEIIEFEKLNKENPFAGTIKMLSKWRTDTEIKNQIPKLKTALKIAGLTEVAKSFSGVLEKESAKIKAKLRKVSGDGKEGKAGTSTAVAEKEAKNKKTPAKKTAQKGTKTMETKPISAKKVPRDGPKPGGLNVES